jgi:glycosidase
MRKKIVVLLAVLFYLIIQPAAGQQGVAVYPTHWWVGMNWNKLQLMLYCNDREQIIAVDKLVVTSSSPDVKIVKVHRVENRRYLFVDVQIASNARAQTVTFSIGGIVMSEIKKVIFQLKPRRKGNGSEYANGVTAADLVYLIMPDRFSNGDSDNDRIPGMLDQSLRRDTVFNRHGGDLKGIENHLDYLHDLGVTALWLNPVIENDRIERTEHGYAFTNHYKIDARLGGVEAYKSLINAAHAKGFKIIQDAVYNHVDTGHFFIRDKPTKDWVNQWPTYTNTTYKEQALFDPYFNVGDRKKMTDGWFVPEMADLNHRNPFLQNFLIQHALWTVEEFGIDGWRIDTYFYNDLAFMNRCNKALYDEYPNISIFGETWVHGVPNQSYFCENNYHLPYKSNLQATTDFQLLFYGIQEALTKPFGWTDGLNKLYTTTAQDFVYKNPMRQVIFLDNHDLPRFYSLLKEDTAKYKMAMAWLLTFRGIPQLYYGNEVLMTGLTTPTDGYVRQDFPGGWPGDPLNKFTEAGRTTKENNVFNYIKKLANFRKASSAIKSGRLQQYVPEDGVYVYFRYDGKQTIMCVLNQNNEAKTINLNRFSDRTKEFSKASDVISGRTIVLSAAELVIPSNQLLVMELQ